MERIEYDNPLATARPERVARGEKARREGRRQKPAKKVGPIHRDRDQTDDMAESEDTRTTAGADQGKRIDLEA